MKLTGPLFSESAHGDFAGLFRYQRRGSVNYVKRINKLPTTASAAQLEHRAKYKQIWLDWDDVPFLTRIYWTIRAAEWGFNSGQLAYLFWHLGWRP